MDFEQSHPLTDLWAQIIAFLPTLAAGLLVIALGVAAGWLAKRALIRLLIWLRLDRLAGRAGWRAALGKGDVRFTIYNLAGNLVMFVIVLVFLDDALERWGSLALSRIIDNIVFILPNLALVAVIVTAGLAAANAIAQRITESLEEEGVRRARFFGKGVKAAFTALIVAIALWQLRLAQELVLAAFLIAFGSIGLAFAIGVGLGSFKAIESGLTNLFREKDDER